MRLARSATGFHLADEEFSSATRCAPAVRRVVANALAVIATIRAFKSHSGAMKFRVAAPIVE
jgi:hypothetical protein